MPEEYDYVITKPPLDDVLERHGVKGQKWGIRKQRPVLGLARRRVNTGIASTKSRLSKYTKNSKKRKGYSSKDYKKYRKRGMNHNQAIEAAKRDRKKKIAAVAIGAAALTIGVLAARKHNIKIQEAKRLANRTGDTNALEKQLKERAKRGALEQKWTEAVKKAGGDQTKVDPSKIKVSGNEVKKYAHKVTEMTKQASERAEARKLKNRVKSGVKRWWNGA